MYKVWADFNDRVIIIRNIAYRVESNRVACKVEQIKRRVRIRECVAELV